MTTSTAQSRAKGACLADELQKRIQLEALAIGFPGAIVVAMALGLLQREGLMPHALRDLRDVWGFLPWPYFLGPMDRQAAVSVMCPGPALAERR